MGLILGPRVGGPVLSTAPMRMPWRMSWTRAGSRARRALTGRGRLPLPDFGLFGPYPPLHVGVGRLNQGHQG